MCCCFPPLYYKTCVQRIFREMKSFIFLKMSPKPRCWSAWPFFLKRHHQQDGEAIQLFALHYQLRLYNYVLEQSLARLCSLIFCTCWFDALKPATLQLIIGWDTTMHFFCIVKAIFDEYYCNNHDIVGAFLKATTAIVHTTESWV